MRNNTLTPLIMDKDVKKIISEAFDELYKELISEDASALEAGLSPQEKAKADAQLQRAQKYGDRGGFAYDFAGEDKSGQKVFNYVVDKLIDDYKVTGNPKSKAAIQAAFFPAMGSKTLSLLRNKWQKPMDELQNGAAAAYETFINNFDGHMDAYNTGTGGFSALVLKNLNNGLKDYFTKGYRGKGLGGGQDAFSAQAGGLGQLDAPEGGEDGGRTLGDKLAAGELGVDTPSVAAGFSDKEEAIANRKEILDVIYGWLENNVSTKQYIAFRELTKGNSPNEVYEDNPDVFRDGKDVSRNFKQLMSSTKKDAEGTYSPVDRLSELISQAYGINFDMKNIIPKNLRQTVSMDPEFSGSGERTYVASPEVKAANKELNDIVTNLDADTLGQLGIKNKNDYNSGAKISKIIDKLMVLGKESEASDISDAWDAVKRARASSEDYGKKVQFADKPDDEFANMFVGLDVYDGFDMEVLMERVMKRLSK